MSTSGEDSETAEWEREQMQRGTQSRQQKRQQPKTEDNRYIIDATAVKRNVSEEIEKAETSMNSIKKNIGSTQIDLAKSEKRIDALKKQIESVEANNSIFEELGSSDKQDDILDFVKKYRHVIAKLPHDQKEMIDLLEKRVKDLQPNMDID